MPILQTLVTHHQGPSHKVCHKNKALTVEQAWDKHYQELKYLELSLRNYALNTHQLTTLKDNILTFPIMKFQYNKQDLG